MKTQAPHITQLQSEAARLETAYATCCRETKAAANTSRGLYTQSQAMTDSERIRSSGLHVLVREKIARRKHIEAQLREIEARSAMRSAAAASRAATGQSGGREMAHGRDTVPQVAGRLVEELEALDAAESEAKQTLEAIQAKYAATVAAAKADLAAIEKKAEEAGVAALRLRFQRPASVSSPYYVNIPRPELFASLRAIAAGELTTSDTEAKEEKMLKKRLSVARAEEAEYVREAAERLEEREAKNLVDAGRGHRLTNEFRATRIAELVSELTTDPQAVDRLLGLEERYCA